MLQTPKVTGQWRPLRVFRPPISFFCHFSYFANWALKLGTKTLEDISHKILGGRHFKLVNGLALVFIAAR